MADSENSKPLNPNNDTIHGNSAKESPVEQRGGGCFWPALILTLLFIMLVGGGIVGGWMWLERWAARPYGPNRTVSFAIRPGTNNRQIASDLRANGLIDHERAWLIWLKVSGNLGKIQAGEYQIEAP